MQYFNERIETMSLEEKRELQGKDLREIVERVYHTVRPYREKMEAVKLKPSDIKGIDDIVKLPFTTKHDLRENYPFGMFSAPKSEIIRLHASSGTTGKLTVVGYTKKDIDVWAECCARSLVGAGGSKNSTVQVSYGYGLFTGGLGMHYGGEMLGATVVPTSSGNTQRQIQLMMDFKADILCCTPSYAIYLAEEIEKMGLKPDEIPLKIGLFGAEPWSREMRLEIERKLGITAVDIYGLSEISGPGVACECSMQTGAHIQDDFFYPEIVSEETLEPVAHGKVGELVFTTLKKEGIPLLRYRTRDITALDYDVCPCGRTSPRIKRVTGRSDDMMIIRGVNVFPSQIESVLMTEQAIAPHYHINIDRINNLDTMEIELELSDSAAFDRIDEVERVKRKLGAEIASAIGISAKITLLSSGSIVRSEGKACRVTDRRKI